jgi:hypothetical protein
MTNLTSCQEQAASKFAGWLINPDEREFVLTGPAGTGKTFLVQQLIKEARNIHDFHALVDEEWAKYHKSLHIDFCATTHKAASVLSESLNTEVHTINAYTGIVPRYSKKTRDMRLQVPKGYLNTRKNTYHTHLLIVDESSMIAKEFYTKFFSKWLLHSPDTKVLWIGDKHQLPPVKEKMCVIFEDDIPQAELKQVVRQSQSSQLSQVVQTLRTGVEEPEKLLGDMPDGSDGSVVFHKDLKSFLAEVENTWPDYDSDPDAKILAWTNARVGEFASYLRKFWGAPEHFEAGETVWVNSAILDSSFKIKCMGSQPVKILDSEIKTEEDTLGRRYLVMYDRFGEAHTDWFFMPDSQDDKKATIARLYQEKQYDMASKVKFTWADFRQNQSMTVHKSQGSTYEKVFVDASNLRRSSDLRKLQYVAASRASKELHILGEFQ